MLAAYAGREGELINHLTRMKNESTVDALVKELNPGKSTKELMDAYEGREEELIGHLETMKEMKASESAGAAPSNPPSVVGSPEGEWIDIAEGAPAANVADEVGALVKELNPGKTTEELMAAYVGREEELLSHLKKLKSSKTGEIV